MVCFAPHIQHVGSGRSDRTPCTGRVNPGCFPLSLTRWHTASPLALGLGLGLTLVALGLTRAPRRLSFARYCNMHNIVWCMACKRGVGSWTEGGQIVCNSYAIVLQPCGRCMWEGQYNDNWLVHNMPISERISGKGQLAENDDWITAELTIPPGGADPLYCHKDHLFTWSLSFTRYCHYQYCMVYGINRGSRGGVIYCARVAQSYCRSVGDANGRG